MPEGKSCERCARSGHYAKNVVCRKTKQLTCKDCCVRGSGGFGSCQEWKFCWPTFYI